jgi:hypothetical protein
MKILSARDESMTRLPDLDSPAGEPKQPLSQDLTNTEVTLSIVQFRSDPGLPASDGGENKNVAG